MDETKTLKTLSQHNSERYTAAIEAMSHTPIRNGILCPHCQKAELWDSDPMATLTTSPPQKRIHCTECSYYGTRFA